MIRAVVFFREGSRPLRPFWMRWVKPGFHHAGVAVRIDAGLWAVLDPARRRYELNVSFYTRRQIKGLLQAHGFAFVETVVDETARAPSWAAILTCVEVCKRVIGLRDRWVWTPWQLYQALLKRNHAHAIG